MSISNVRLGSECTFWNILHKIPTSWNLIDLHFQKKLWIRIQLLYDTALQDHPLETFFKKRYSLRLRYFLRVLWFLWTSQGNCFRYPKGMCYVPWKVVVSVVSSFFMTLPSKMRLLILSFLKVSFRDLFKIY